ncbi:MAG TPA: hypothetical protein VGB63_10595 [Pedobacter sp.]|jgi:hypothetical protein
MSHTFHIPVLGLGYSIDTPLKVARFGISSTVSIVDDELIERMRQYHLEQNHQGYQPIKKTDSDHRAKRITAYLNLLNDLLQNQFQELGKESFEPGSEIEKYFRLLPENSLRKQFYSKLLEEQDQTKRVRLQEILRSSLRKGSIDVNIMSKVDKMNFSKEGEALDEKFSDALASLRGFAESTLESALILSAGMNPRLYSYLEEFHDFFPLHNSAPKKKIILKVSDFRSAFIQAKFLAKKGLWVHEFRIESGLNCGGHAFATEGFLLGPILEEFKQRRFEMVAELRLMYKAALTIKQIYSFPEPVTRITVQGGIGTVEEDKFLTEYYNLDGTGWGSPFLLVPEATNVDEDMLNCLKGASEDDFYISGASPLGIPFNNFKKSSSETQRLERLAKGRPGSPCTKKFLVSNTEFTEKPICTASREYQNLKLKQLDQLDLPASEHQELFSQITEKICLCQGLTTSVYIKNNILKPKENSAVAICPGPNTAYFSSIYSLEEMVNHIYGRVNLLKDTNRPHVFINELKLYVDYLKKDIAAQKRELSDKKQKQLERFKEQLLIGISYYHQLIPTLKSTLKTHIKLFENDLKELRHSISEIQIGVNQEVSLSK